MASTKTQRHITITRSKKMYKIFILVSVMLFQNLVFAEETITWGVYEWPPMHITEGEHMNQGLYDGILEFFSEKMPEYKHKRIIANAKRFWRWIQAGKQFCYVSSIPTEERLKYAYFSLPSGFHVANSVIILKERLEEFGQSNVISLSELMQNRQLTGGAVDGRSYGKDIDEVIAENTKYDNFATHTTGNLGQSVFSMLLYKRLDYIIEYPFVASYFEKVLNVGDQTVSLEIKESNPFGMGYTACPKNEWGRNVIDRINTILKESRTTEEYRKILERWQSEKSKKLIRENYDIFLNTGN